MRTPTLLAMAMVGLMGTAALAQTAPAPAPPVATQPAAPSDSAAPPMGGPGRMGGGPAMQHGAMGGGPGMGGPGMAGPGMMGGGPGMQHGAMGGGPGMGGPGMGGPGGHDGMMRMHDRMQAMHGRMHGDMHGMHRGFDPRTFALIVPQADRNLSTDDVKKIAEGFLLWNGNHTWKVVDVAPVADKGIGFSLATPDGTVIAKFAMDPKTGRVSRLG